MENQKFTEIEKMAEIVKSYCDVCPVKDKEQETCLLCKMEHLYNHNYRQVNEDLAIQCTCYSLGCQEGEKIKQTTAKEIIDLADEVLEYFDTEEKIPQKEKVLYKTAIRFFSLKIMERYGV
jgi:hypothetical protein